MTEQKSDQQIVDEYKKRLLRKREYAKEYYKKNKLKIYETQKKRYLENKEKHKEYYNNNLERAREYYNNNRDKIIQRAKEYYHKKKEVEPLVIDIANNQIEQKNEL